MRAVRQPLLVRRDIGDTAAVDGRMAIVPKAGFPVRIVVMHFTANFPLAYRWMLRGINYKRHHKPKFLQSVSTVLFGAAFTADLLIGWGWDIMSVRSEWNSLDSLVLLIFPGDALYSAVDEDEIIVSTRYLLDIVDG